MFRALANCGDLGCNYIDLVALEPNTSIGLHRHGPHDTEIYVIVEGLGEMTIEDETLFVTTGDVVVNPPNGTHGLVNVGNILLKLVVIDVPVAHDATS
ncbi:cupin domain-containing protein [Candidatus Burkholderia verschuerenii]|uniref:cupin domain-containing protein n=1 Tax=Candidatus Burkholderia verschuerenii TaxID=242163 RepID=UPI000A6AD3D8|nr:cupin domain-containing protein [Candidatus Burkholderia verschuerenii]